MKIGAKPLIKERKEEKRKENAIITKYSYHLILPSVLQEWYTL